MVLGLLLVGCGTTIIETQTPEEFDSIARARGYSYTARAQPASWITADGLVEYGDKQVAQGAHYTQQQANQIALNLCSRIGSGCVIVRESGRISREAESIIARLKKDQEKKQKIEEEKKKEEDQLAKEKKEKEEEKIEKEEADDDWF